MGSIISVAEQGVEVMLRNEYATWNRSGNTVAVWEATGTTICSLEISII